MPTSNGWTIRRKIYYFLLVNGLSVSALWGQCDSIPLYFVQSQFDALIDIFNSTNGTSWDNNDGWDENCLYCEWEGVSCSSGMITALRLTQNNLQGTLPYQIIHLNQLRALFLERNKISGDIPELPNTLQRISFQDNLFSGAIPSTIFSLGNLKILDLGRNNFSGGLSPLIGNLAQLENLRIHNNDLSGSLPDEIGNCINLERITLSGNRFSGGIPRSFSEINDLKSIFLDNNNFEGCLEEEDLYLCTIPIVSLRGNCLFTDFSDFCAGDGCQGPIVIEKRRDTVCYGNFYTFEIFTDIDNQFIEWTNGITSNRFTERIYDDVTYGVTVTGPDCEFYDEISVFVSPTPESFIEEIICPEDEYFIEGESFSFEGEYDILLTTSTGCDSLIHLSLSHYPQPTTFLSSTICSGDAYLFEGTELSASGEYTEYLTSQHGCDSTVTLSLEVEPLIIKEVHGTLCVGGEFVYQDESFSSEGIYEIEVDGSPCDTLVILELSEEPPLEREWQAQICEGETLTYRGYSFSEEGYYEFWVSGAFCDSLILLDLKVHIPEETVINARICTGDGYVFEGNEIVEEGIYTQVYTTVDGCDSIITLDLVVDPPILKTLEIFLCVEDIFTYGSNTFDKEGFYEFTVEGSPCDTLIELDILFYEENYEDLIIDLCPGESFTIGSEIFTETGIYVVTLTDENGCDSTIYLDLLVYEDFFISDEITICAGEVYQRGGREFSETGVYTLTSNGLLCDTTIELSLTVLPPLSTTIQDAFCLGMEYKIGDQFFDEPGTFKWTSSTLEGCDSTTTLILEATPLFIQKETIIACEGEEVNWQNNIYTIPGQYEVIYTSSSGCDSIYELELVMDDETTIQIEETICAGDIYTLSGVEYSETGFYERTIPGPFCDTIYLLQLVVADEYLIEENESICPGSTLLWNNQELKEAGRYEAFLISSRGCDSTVHLYLDKHEGLESTIEINICEGESYEWNGLSYREPGIYHQKYTSGNGCDSTVELQLSTSPIPEQWIVHTLCEGEEIELYGTLYNKAGIFSQSIPGPVCDSTITIQISVEKIDSHYFSESICQGETFLLFGTPYTESGLYEMDVREDGLCDSRVFLDLKVIESKDSQESVIICTGESYHWLGQDYDQSGTYEEIFQGSTGCDSTVSLMLQVLEPSILEESISICTGESIKWNDREFTESGTYVYEDSTEEGCPRTSILYLSVDEVIETHLSVTICAGESYYLGDDSLSVSGQYNKSFSTDRCDSVVYLDLIVNDLYDQVIEKTICGGSTIEYNGEIITSTGAYLFNFMSMSGCDSTVTLLVSTSENGEITLLNEILCDGQIFEYAGQIFSDAGTYRIPTQPGRECSDTTILNLVVVEPMVGKEVEFLCPGDSIRIGLEWVFSADIYEHFSLSSTGCDSLTLTEVHLIEEEVSMVASSLQICSGSEVELHLNGEISTVLWEDGTNDLTRIVKESGIYRADITTQEGCSIMQEVEIQETLLPDIKIQSADILPCEGKLGQIFIDDSDYLLSADGGKSWHADNITLFSAGIYPISVATLDTLCMWNNVEVLEIKEEVGLEIIEISSQDANNCTNPNGMILINTIGGNRLFYSIDGGTTFVDQPLFQQVEPGEYSVVVKTEDNGCIIEWKETIIISGPDILTAQLIVEEEILCAGAASGSLRIESNNPVSYVWSNGAEESHVTGLPAGQYYVVVTSEQGCVDTMHYELVDGTEMPEWVFPQDTAVCLDDTVWIDLGEAPELLEFYGDSVFIWENDHLGIYTAGSYYAEYYENEYCNWMDHFILESIEEDFSGIEFLIGQEGLVGEYVTAIDVSWPPADDREWMVFDTAVELVEIYENQATFRFMETGIYEIGMMSYIGDCDMLSQKTIQIYRDSSELQFPQNHGGSGGGIVDFSLFPNPNNGNFQARIRLSKDAGIRLVIVDHTGQRIHDQEFIGEQHYLVPYQLDNLAPGLYALILYTGNRQRFIVWNKV